MAPDGNRRHPPAPPGRPPGVSARQDLETRAATLYNAKQYKEALSLFRELVALAPSSAWAHDGVGDCLSHLGQAREAVASYRRAADLSPADAEAQYWYANSLMGIEYGEAAIQFKKLTVMEPKKARGFLGVGRALASIDRCSEAVAAYGRAVTLCKTCLDDWDREAHTRCRGEMAH